MLWVWIRAWQKYSYGRARSTATGVEWIRFWEVSRSCDQRLCVEFVSKARTYMWTQSSLSVHSTVVCWRCGLPYQFLQPVVYWSIRGEWAPALLHRSSPVSSLGVEVVVCSCALLKLHSIWTSHSGICTCVVVRGRLHECIREHL